jgi:hypothetical protein
MRKQPARARILRMSRLNSHHRRSEGTHRGAARLEQGLLFRHVDGDALSVLGLVTLRSDGVGTRTHLS